MSAMCKPSVAILHYTCPPVVGGVEQLIAVHAGLLADHGFPTQVIAGKGEQARPDVPLRLLPSLYSKDPRLLAINEDLDRGEVTGDFEAMAEGILSELRKALVGVDVCVVHNAFTLHFNLPLTAALRRLAERGGGPRFVAWCHDVSWENPLYLPKMRDAYPWNLLKEAVGGVRYVAVSQLRREELSRLMVQPLERFTVIPAGVDPAVQLRLCPETMGLARRLGLLDAELLMLAPVRITKRKNLEKSLRILHALLGQGVDARLVVTGPPGPHNVRSGDYVAELRDLRRRLRVEREAIFLFEQVGGEAEPSYPVSDRMMYDLYSLSDLLLFSSAQEGFGIPLIEAGVGKLPVFCSNIPPFREIGLDAVEYFELDADPAGVAGRIRGWMATDRVYRLRRRVLKQYSWEWVYRDRIGPLLEGE